MADFFGDYSLHLNYAAEGAVNLVCSKAHQQNYLLEASGKIT